MATKQSEGRRSPALTFEMMQVSMLRPHEKNIRHRVYPDDHLVDSIRQVGVLEPLLVAPNPTLEGDYTVIAGHHRLAAAKRAGLSEVPVIIRHDLHSDEQQVPAMVSENLHRKDLTVSEEIDAVQLMLGFEGWSEMKIAQVTGQSFQAVARRARLAGLGSSARDALDAGQLTFEQAGQLADAGLSSEEADRVVAAARNKWSFEHELSLAKARKQWKEEEPAVRGRLVDAGVEIVDTSVGDAHTAGYRVVPQSAVDSEEQAGRDGLCAVVESNHAGGRVVYLRKAVPEDTTDVDPLVQEWEQQLLPELKKLRVVEARWLKEVVGSSLKNRSSRMRRLFPRVLRTCGVYGFTSALVQLNGLLVDEGGLPLDDFDDLSWQGQHALFAALCAYKPIDSAYFWDVEHRRDSEVSWLTVREALGWQLHEVEQRAVQWGSARNGQP
ncbi:ParB/RepB/Spo0J family partition protein [Auritidibacter ignavus]|uniref:ParB/RepB/Spo0J family partition protein n=1 Tax=Auritidibacter ignavus TaxID=678932 RepID=UPI00244788EF|nr:ParB/RepB/Spo0J family partition protein [Auritidibacter ignavus]WGH80618.1 ParB/RepB/Spo0J family partition protein [Auritidibacter ignavus]